MAGAAADAAAADWSAEDLTADLDAKLELLCGVARRGLAETWLEVGTPPEQRDAAIVGLKERLTATFLDALTAEAAHRDRLRAELSETLGEIERAARELGDAPPEPLAHDEPLLRRLAAASRSLDDWRRARTERAAASAALRERRAALCAALGEDEAEHAARDERAAPLSTRALGALDASVRALDAEAARRGAAARELCAAVGSLRGALAGAAEAEAVAPPARLSAAALDALRAELSSLEATRAQRVAAIRASAARVEQISAKLGLELEPSAAHAAAQDVSERALRRWGAEVERLERLRRASISRLVSEARVELRALWAEMGVPEEEQRKRVSPAVLGPLDADATAPAQPTTARPAAGGTGSTAAAGAAAAGGGAAAAAADTSADALEAGLAEIEAETERLRALQREAAPLLRLKRRREQLLAQRAELEAASADPSRLTSRRDPAGRLLREERARRECAVELPRVSARLLDALGAWEERHAHEIIAGCFDGGALRAQLEAEMAADAAESERKRAPRAGAPAAPAAAAAGGGGATPTRGAAGGGAQTPRSAQPHRAAGAPTPARANTLSRTPGRAAAAAAAAAAGGAHTAPRMRAPAPAEPFRPVPLSLQQILRAAEVDDEGGGGGGVGGPAPSPGPRKTLTYRLRDDAAAAAIAAEAVRRATMADASQRPQTAREHSERTRGAATAMPAPKLRTVESVVKLAARLKHEAAHQPPAGAAAGARGPLHATPSKAVLQAFAESNGVASPADLIDLMTPPGGGAAAGYAAAHGGTPGGAAARGAGGAGAASAAPVKLSPAAGAAAGGAPPPARVGATGASGSNKENDTAAAAGRRAL